MASEAEGHFERAMALNEEGQYEAAHAELRRTVDAAPDHAVAWSELGWLTYALEMGLDDAAEHLERAIRLDPHLGIAHMYLGVVSNRRNQSEAAEAHFRLALGLAEDAALVHTVFAEEFLWGNGRYGEAEEHFRAALEADPNLVLALRDYARMLTWHGRDSEAKEMFQRALQVDPADKYTHAAYDEFLADLVAEDRDPDDCLRAATEKDPHYVGGLRCLQKRNPFARRERSDSPVSSRRQGVGLHKLTEPSDYDSPIVWGQVFCRQQSEGRDRLVIGPASRSLDLMCDLAEPLGPEYFLLYVHAVARSGHELGRYQSPPVQLVDVRVFIQEFAPMLENDARHQLWIASTRSQGMLVYDEHGLIYAYGPLGEFEALLSARGFQEEDVSVSMRHAHHYHAEYDDDVERLLAHWDWLRTDLKPEDER